jgi:hypothetical protein
MQGRRSRRCALLVGTFAVADGTSLGRRRALRREVGSDWLEEGLQLALGELEELIVIAEPGNPPRRLE